MKKAPLFSLLLLTGVALHSQSFVTRPAEARGSARQAAKLEPKKDDCTTRVKFAPTPSKVSFPGPGGKTLYGWVFKPAGSGPFPAVIFNHGSGLEPTKEKGAELASFYAGHGYVLFTPHRTGHGLSKEAGQSVVDKERANCPGPDLLEFRRCKVKYQEEANLDTVAAVEWLKTQPYVKRNRIAMTGVSYGGIQTLLTAEKGLGLRAFVPFTPAAMSWPNLELRKRLKVAVENARQPIFLLQAEGDYSTGPYEVLGMYLNGKGGLNRGKLYPKFGNTPQEAHGGFVVTCQGIEIWGKDVLAFLAAAMN